MTTLEIQTRIVEVISELQTHEEHCAAIRQQLAELVQEM